MTIFFCTGMTRFTQQDTLGQKDGEARDYRFVPPLEGVEVALFRRRGVYSIMVRQGQLCWILRPQRLYTIPHHGY